MNKLKKNIESNAAIFAQGGMEIGIASALLVLNEIPLLSLTGLHKKAGEESTLPIWSAKHILRNIFAAVAIIILSPVLFIISAFILASSLRNGLIKNKPGNNFSVSGDDEILRLFNKNMNEGLFTETAQIFSDRAEQFERMQLERALVNPVRIAAWQILPEDIMLNPDNWVEIEIRYSDIRLQNKNTMLFQKSFQHVLITKC